MSPRRLDLFGGDAKWEPSGWTSSDDRVRGGKSQSYLEISDSGEKAIFKGKLDIKTLGGAGFASQRTASDDASWDLSDYDGIEIVVLKADDKNYTFNIKDNLLPRDPNTGREQSTISYEYDFKITSPSLSSPSTAKKSHSLQIPWSKFNATYRGREKKDARALKKDDIKRFGIMCRSFFGDQEGDFKLVIERISAIKLDNTTQSLGSGKTMVSTDHTEASALLPKSDAMDVERAGGTDADIGPVPKRPLNKMAVLALGSAVAALVLLQCTSIPMTDQVKRWTGIKR